MSLVIDRMKEIETFVSIQGNIGSGKSTLMSALKNYVERNGLSALNPSPPPNSREVDRFLFIDEPVEEWCKENCSLLNHKGEGDDHKKYAFLDLFYKDMKEGGPINRFAFDFQAFTFTSRMGNTLRMIGQLPQLESAYPVRIHIISERSIRTDRVFFKNVYETNGVYDFQWRNYEQFFNIVCGDTLAKEDAMIRLNTSAAKSYERHLEKRKREAEIKNGIPLAYFESLETQHEEMYRDFKRENGVNNVIDVNFEKDMTEEEIEQLGSELISRIKALSLEKRRMNSLFIL